MLEECFHRQRMSENHHLLLSLLIFRAPICADEMSCTSNGADKALCQHRRKAGWDLRVSE